MKNIFYLAAMIVGMSSCGGDSETTDQTTDSTNIDTVAMVNQNIAIDLNSLLAKVTVSTSLPYIQDSSYLFDPQFSDSAALTADEAVYLSYGFVESELSYSGVMRVEDFVFFDSLKANGEYEAYVEVADIGMMVRSDAYVSQKVTLDDSTFLLLWCISFGTYEACPYSSGTVLYATVFRNNEATSCTIIGEDSGGADAPVWSETLCLSSLKPGNFSVWKRDKNCSGETDEEGNDLVDISSEEFTLNITPQGVWEVVRTSPEL